MSDHKFNPRAIGGPVMIPIVRDAFGRSLSEGDLIFLQTIGSQPYKIIRINPVVDPTAPQNLMEITIQSVLKFRSVREERCAEFVRVIAASENAINESASKEPDPPAPSPDLLIVRPKES